MRMKCAVAAFLFCTVPFFCFDGKQQAIGESTQAQAPLPQAQEPIDPQMKANILKLLDLSHASNMGQNMVKGMMQQMRPQLLASLPATPHRDQIVDAYGDKLAALLSSSEVMNEIAAIYAKHLSADDISALIQFYQTPAGQHSLAAMPQIVAESMQVGANAARTNVPLVLDELCKQYPELHGKVNFCPADKDESGELEKEIPPFSALLAATGPR